MNAKVWRSDTEHAHQCRECGEDITHDDDPCNWAGGNTDCYCATEDDVEEENFGESCLTAYERN